MLTHIVAGPDELTPDWFNVALEGARGDVVITDVQAVPFGNGVIAQMLRVGLRYDAETEAPASVIVKLPTEDPGSLAVARAMRLYELEVRFYQDVAPLLSDMSIPRSFFSEFDEESGRFTLVLEDLSGTTSAGSVFTPVTPEQASAVLGQLVRFQAPLWNSTKVADLPWLSDPAVTHALFDQLPLGLDGFISRFQDKLDPAHVDLFASTLPKAGQWARSWRAPTVLQHGDFRTDNVLFGTTAASPDATIIDFQALRLGPPGVDPAYFLGSALPTEERRRIERDLITEYHQRLIAAGVDGFSFDDAWQSYREGALYGVFLFVGMGGQVEASEHADRVMADQIRRYADMAIDLESAAAAGLA